MDLIEAMNLWQDMGNEIISWNKEDGYYCLFVKKGIVKGHTKAVPGGMYWSWPDELMEYRKNELEVAQVEDQMNRGE